MDRQFICYQNDEWGGCTGSKVLEEPRAGDNGESIVKMLRRMDKQSEKLTAKFQTSMGEIDKKWPKQEQL